MSEAPSLDKRRAERVKVQLELSFADGRRFCTGELRDISSTGAGVEALEGCPRGTRLTLVLPLRPPVKLQGEIQWVVQDGLHYRMGIRFLGIGPAEEREIKRLVEDLKWSRR
ncbi:PilZ domain-containing protein [Dissulfurirhabdus thermomarina]|uniref:PilZ domain-containing protein n=1 Tax=Dissulfurirhabdus thermomarina TaxID=1765737 RepID=A0A6N9TP89_DISTH|nr:PilZ domain-containing protein [Dissulfurirhabdus thermomarina]NDY43075.1 PilZ domain-containing protein [Dissulfurirhabdus thermomarina]NMX22388.1 PilZ domain-containing protein [Dissulfurirhabdus thermomarina]